jgi:hypothetical protein
MGRPDKRMLTAEEAAEYCGFASVNGFRAHIAVRPVNFGKLVRYDRADLDAFLDRFRSSLPGGNILELAGNEGARRGH